MVMDQDPMETLPAPDMVGREFVRQYYTLLNEAPEHAHRFYNSNSYFVHGSMTKPAIGQVEIHQKIQQLNFRDCHAKISQVDSQVTLGNGVVVQVSGELSNDGEPMRRFSQTFVLGTQSPKKYYVHNDIFRYQDMLQSDEEGEPSPEKEDPAVELQQETPPHEYYPQPTVVEQPQMIPTQVPPAQIVEPVPAMTHVNVNGGGAAVLMEDPRAPEPVIVEPPAVPVMNGGPIMAEDLPPMMPAQGIVDQPPINRSVPAPEPVISHKDEYEEESIQENYSDGGEQKTTFANLFKNGRSDRGAPRGGITRSGPGSNMHVRNHGPPPSVASSDHGNDMSPGTGLSGPPPRGPPPGADIRRNYSDAQQLFMGSLPPDATEKDLRVIFNNFGRVLDLKVNTSNKGPGNFKNYGFVTYESADSVTQCLNSKPIYFNSESGSVELTIEAKNQHRTSVRGGSQDGRGGSGGWPMGRGQSGRGRGAPRGVPRGSFSRGAPLPSRPFPNRR